jgi:hypothetical protein
MTATKETTVVGKKAGNATPLGLRVGDRVEVRSQEEILATLDENGELDSLPFMPEMLAFCGQTLAVEKVAHKACDTTVPQGGIRKMHDAVHLSTARCDGSAHGGCQNGCRIYWKEAWLKRPGDSAPEPKPGAGDAPRMTLPLLQVTTRRPPGPDGEELFACQATELQRATEPQPFLEAEQYITDYRSGNANLFWIVRAFLIGLFNRLQNKSRRLLPERLWLRGGRRWPFLRGRAVGRTPTAQLDLQPGERVRIKPKAQIEETLNADLLNRGMGFDGEMARFCGREAVVQRRVTQVIDEKTRRMVHLKTPSVVLDGLVCEGAYSSTCPRGWICFWREIWLDRVEDK